MADRGAQLAHHGAEGASDVPDFVTAVDGHGGGEVAASEPRGRGLDLLDRAHQTPGEHEAHRERSREPERCAEREVQACVADRFLLVAQRGGDAQIQPLEPPHHAIQALADRGSGRREHHLRAAELRPELQRGRPDRLDGHQAARPTERGAHHGVRGLAVRNQRLRGHGQGEGIEGGVARSGQDPALGLQEDDASRPVPLLEGACVVIERRSVAHLQGRPELRCAGDRAVALRDRFEMVLDQPLGGRRGALEAALRGSLEVSRQRALLERQHQDRAGRGHPAHRREQAREEPALHDPGTPSVTSTRTVPSVTSIFRSSAGRRSFQTWRE